MPAKYEVGQRLWWVPSERYLGSPRYVTITKVGRRWMTTQERDVRIDIETLAAYGQDYRVGQCYETSAEWDAKRERIEAWSELRRAIDRQRDAPDGLASEDIRQALRILKLRKYDE